ncbi:MAG: hypothetical protein NTX92_06820 [Euryarchaeota archaeon]|nr:hypothetical protein [Euryarchaeota archaeon]
MSKTKNSVLTTQVFEALFTVVGRRTLDSFAIQILKTTLEKLETKFDFLTLVTIHDDFFSDDGIQATFEQTFDTIEPSRLGEAIDARFRRKNLNYFHNQFRKKNRKNRSTPGIPCRHGSTIIMYACCTMSREGYWTHYNLISSSKNISSA